jgi:hypothetical protein
MSNQNNLLVDKLLVLKRDGENLQLPATKHLVVKAPDDTPHGQYLMFRVNRFENESGELWLKHERDSCGARAFEISIEVNSEALLAHDIKTVCIVKEHSGSYLTSKSFNSDINLNQRYNATKPSFQEADEEPKRLMHNQEINLPVKDIYFEDGKASFNVFVNPSIRSLRFEIENPFLKKEYDAIKNYFAKALQVKKFLIQIKVEYTGSEVFNQSATCLQIAQIDDSLLKKIEDDIIENEFVLNEDEIIFTADKLEEIARALDNEEIKDPEWLLNKLITKEKTKHYYHLRFLSSKQAVGVTNLRLTGKPLSFIFLLEIDEHYYLVWETYKTDEATYLWRLKETNQQELKNEIEKLIDRIKWLRKANKLSYINSKPENFKRIEHEYGAEDNGFKKWKVQLDDFIFS